MEGALPGTGDTDGVLALKEVTFHRVTDLSNRLLMLFASLPLC